MRYADRNCTVSEQFYPEHSYIFAGKCIISGNEVSVLVKAKELYKYRQGEYIQDALKSNTPDEREFLMSGISGDKFDELYGGEDE